MEKENKRKMENERALEMIDKMFDLLTDTMGRRKTLEELRLNYELTFSEDELRWLLRGAPSSVVEEEVKLNA
jgi:hypothetical protein